MFPIIILKTFHLNFGFYEYLTIYTLGEQIGIDYLFRQTGQVIDPPVYDNNGEEIESAETVSADEEAEEDEGFQDVEDPTISLDSAFLQDLSPAQTQASEATDPAATETQTSAQIEAHQRPCEAGKHFIWIKNTGV